MNSTEQNTTHTPKVLPVSDSHYWSQRYQENQTGWDTGSPSGVLIANFSTIQGHMANKEKHSAFVPGAGFGHDALYLAEEGLSVVALDFAREPMDYLEQRARALDLPILVEIANVFQVSVQRKNTFSLIWEYTCYCAIDPQRRGEYLNVLAELLEDHGLLVVLLFPISERDPDSAEGPPFPVSFAQFSSLASQAGLLVRQVIEAPTGSHPARAGKESLIFLGKKGRE